VQWIVMRTSARLRLEPRPSRIGCIAVLGACALAAGLLATLALPLTVTVAGGCLVFASLVSSLWRCSGCGVPALLHVGLDRRITVTGSDGRSQSGAILDDSYVGAWLTVIVWRTDDLPWWRPAGAVLVLVDTLPQEDFRRLRVVLRYGRAAATSGEEAG
jgi:hypothetical protein